MCESLMKFESKRPGALSDRRDSLPHGQYSHTINTLNIEISRSLLLRDSIKFFSRHREYHDMAVNAKYRLGKESVLGDNPICSNILISIKTAIAVIFKRNKTSSKAVDTGYRIAFFQLV